MESQAQSKKRKMSTNPLIGDEDQLLHLSTHNTCESSEQILSAQNATSEIPQGVFPCSGESKEEHLLCGSDKAGVPGASGKEAFTCRICNRDINAHRNFHEVMDIFKCCFCKHITDTKYNLVIHIANHGTDPFFCMVCNERFKKKGSHDALQTCGVCEKKFLCKSLLLEHSLNHKLHCMICWKEIDEYETECIGKKRYDCCKCEYKTKRMCDLRIHFLSHFEEKAYGCDKCLKRFKYKYLLNQHQQNCHPKEQL